MRGRFWHRSLAVAAMAAAQLLPLAAQALKPVAKPPKGADPRKVELPRGEIVEKIVVAGVPAQSYALYLPSGYRPDRLWPILYTFDPRGHGKLAAQVFKPGAETYGYIVASSYNSASDGPLEPNVAAMRAMWSDTHSKLAIDDKRIYAAGFSGTVRSSCILANAAPGSIQGIVAAGAGFPVDQPPTRQTAFSYYGTVGTLDFNYDEVTDLDLTLDDLGLPHRVEVFSGHHEWMPPALATRAIAWMELQAMKSGRRPKDSAFVDGLWSRDRGAADALLAGGKPYPAFRAYRALLADFTGLRDTADLLPVQAKVAELAAAEPVRREARERQERSKRDHAYLEQAARILGTGVPPAGASEQTPRSVGEVVAELRIDELRKKAKATETDEGLAAQRLLNGLSVQTSFYMPRLFVERKEYDRALWCLDIAVQVDPDDSGAWFSEASIYSRRGDRKKALQRLERAVQTGWDDRARLETDPAFEPLRGDPAFQQLLAKIVKPPAPADKS